MSVLACERNNCENIMCNRYSYNYGYICDECFAEMKSRQLDIASFMGTPKGGDRERNYNYDGEFTL